MPLTEEERKEFHELIQITIHRSMSSYIIPKEQHYKDHLWVNEWREWQSSIKSTIWKTIVGLVIGAFMTLIFYGFILFGKMNFK